MWSGRPERLRLARKGRGREGRAGQKTWSSQTQGATSTSSHRPKTSFNWFVNPLKTFIFFIWRRYWRILVLLLLLALITIFLLLVFYTIPGQISEVIFSPVHKH